MVYVPICHMTWGDDGTYFADRSVLGFAGGIVVHVTACVGVLMTCNMVGPRKGYGTQPMFPHNSTMTETGTAMLWVGCFGFSGPSASGFATGAMARLAAETLASGFIGPVGDLSIGIASGVVCFLAWIPLKAKFGYDDSLDVSVVHSVSGLVCVQFHAATITAVYTLGVTWAVLKITDTLVGLRVTKEREQKGLDLSLHEESGYRY